MTKSKPTKKVQPQSPASPDSVAASAEEELRQIQVTLEESRNRYFDLYELAPVGYLTLSKNGLIDDINFVGAALLGEERQRLFQRRFAGFVAAADSDNWHRYFSSLQHGDNKHCELTIRRADGSSINTMLSSMRTGKVNDAQSVYIILTDITERKRAEELQRKLSEEISDLYNHAPCGYHSLDKDGVILQINDTELEWLGYTRDEVVGKMKLADIMTPASQLVFRENYPRFMKQGFVRDLEFDIIRKDRTVISTLVSATAIYDQGGDYLMSRSTLVDISRRKVVERSLSESEARLRIAINVSNSVMWEYDLETGNVILSEGWSKLLGGEEEPTFTTIQALTALVPEEEQQLVRNAIIGAIKGNVSSSYKITHRVRKQDGEYIWINSEGYVTERDPDGGARRMTGINRDITERKKMLMEIKERRVKMTELQKLQTVGQTAAAIAHELNQPLMAITSYSIAARILLQAEKPDLDEVREAITATERQAHRAGESIRNLLEYLRMKEFPSEAFDLNQEILGVMDTAKSEHELQFNTVLQLDEGQPLVQANRTHIQKVLLNLMHNGIEAMREMGLPLPSITVVVRTIKDSGVAQVTIQDNGPGIKEDDLKRLFEPFFTTKPEGIGMGLSISRSLIEANGGQLWIDPQERPGATFHFTLPLAT